MTPMQKALIAKAIPNLALENIVLHESRLERPGSLPADGESKVGTQYRRGVGFNIEKSSDPALLFVKVDLGVRLVDASDLNDSDPIVYVVIEADYVLIYRMLGELDDESITEFAEANSVHNAWPFWRHHVFDIVQRGNLPKIDIPLYQGALFDVNDKEDLENDVGSKQ